MQESENIRLIRVPADTLEMRRYARYGLWIIFSLVSFGLLVFLASKALVDPGMVYEGEKSGFHYEAAEVEEKNVYIAWAEWEGNPRYYLRSMNLCDPDNFNFSIFSESYPYFRRPDQAIDSASQIEVKQKLSPASYVLELSCGQNSVILPLNKIASDTYVSPPVILLNRSGGAYYFHGVRALSCKPGLLINFNFKKVVSNAP